VLVPHPIQTRIGSVFVPVTDLARATGFYSMLLGLPVDPSIRHEHLYWFQLPNGTDIVLDSKITRGEGGAHPLFYLGTSDIDGALRHLVENGVVIAGEMQRGDVSAFRFKDPDGNLLMICDCPAREATS
jgi:predicted enzyme related to lactoylglutathione lyase